MDDFGLGYTGDWLDDPDEDEREIISRELDELDGFHIEALDDEEDELYDIDDYEYDGPESVAEPEGV